MLWSEQDCSAVGRPVCSRSSEPSPTPFHANRGTIAVTSTRCFDHQESKLVSWPMAHERR
jgi:hypothetical protein